MEIKIAVNMKHYEGDAMVQLGHYHNGNCALSLVTEDTGEPLAKATINIPDVKLDEHDVIIKDYAENEGILDTLVNEKVIAPTNDLVFSMTDGRPLGYMLYSRKHAVFKIINKFLLMPENHMMFHCFNCGYRYHRHKDSNTWKYCPNCSQKVSP